MYRLQWMKLNNGVGELFVGWVYKAIGTNGVTSLVYYAPQNKETIQTYKNTVHKST